MKKITRRSFVAGGAKAGGALLGASLVPGLLRSPGQAAAAEPEAAAAPGASTPAVPAAPPAPAAPVAPAEAPAAVPTAAAPALPPDISVVTGQDAYLSTLRAIEELGGMGRFVSRGDRVGLLPNTWAKKPGTYTRPDIVLAVAHLCYEAGAKQVYMLKNESAKYWRRSKVSLQHAALIARLKPADSDHDTVSIPGAKIVKEAEILTEALRYERLINLPIIKHHSGVHMTCTLKNMMGLSAFSTNIRFHLGDTYIRTFIKEFGDFYADLDHFSQSVVDLNRVRPVDLCVVDATEFITTNGPSGPGKMSRPHQVVAGTDRVALDALCAAYVGRKPAEIGMIVKAHEAGLGRLDLDAMRITRTTS